MAKKKTKHMVKTNTKANTKIKRQRKGCHV